MYDTDDLATPTFAIWLTGLPASGKTTIARQLVARLASDERRVQLLDSDEMRTVLTPQPTYQTHERDWFYATLVYIADLLVRNGLSVVIAATGNKRRYRADARQTFTHFAEIYVDCPLAICQARDKKGTYDQAYSGTATTVPGVGSAYEAPHNPDLILDTVQLSTEASVQHVITMLINRKWLSPRVLE